MRNHTCSRHIWCDEKNTKKGDGFEFLEKGTNCTQVFVSQLSEESRPMLCIHVGNYINSKLGNKNCDFFVKFCHNNF